MKRVLITVGVLTTEEDRAALPMVLSQFRSDHGDEKIESIGIMGGSDPNGCNVFLAIVLREEEAAEKWIEKLYGHLTRNGFRKYE